MTRRLTAVLANGVGLLAVLAAVGAEGQSIYRGQDQGGTLTFSNAPTEPGYDEHARVPQAASEDHTADHDFKQTKLSGAVSSGVVARVEKVLAEGVDVNEKASFGRTVLLEAAFAAQPEIVALLIQHGAKVNAADPSGKTALHLAAFRDSPETVKVLLAAGANPNARDNDDRTPLHEAVIFRYPDVIQPLLAAGADRYATDRFGGTPVDYAKNLNVSLDAAKRD